MEFNSILLLCIFLVVSTKVSSYDEDLKIQGNYAKAPVPAAASTPPVVTVTPPAPVRAPPPPLVKSPPYPPPVKGPSPSPSPPSPPYVKAPTPPPAYPPVGKPPLAPSPSPSPPTPTVKSKKDCVPLCTNRCQLHSRTRVCMRACLTCCDRCKCVPPGTYGNREKCGKCYTDMTTHGNRSKCP